MVKRDRLPLQPEWQAYSLAVLVIIVHPRKLPTFLICIVDQSLRACCKNDAELTIDVLPQPGRRVCLALATSTLPGKSCYCELDIAVRVQQCEQQDG